MRRDIALTDEDIVGMLAGVDEEENPALYEKLKELANAPEESRFLIETVESSFMSRQQRLDDLEKLLAIIAENAVRPSVYRKEHQRAITGAISIARTLFWKPEKGERL